MNQKAHIALKNVSRKYPAGQVEALSGVTLDIARGEFVALLGPSGCGKTTLLNLIGCIDRPSAGTILISDSDVTGLSDEHLTEIRRTKIGFVFQFFNLLPTLTVEENVALPLEIGGRSLNGGQIVSGILERVGLSDRADFMPAQLSGGEMQRTALARALVHKPEIVVADEPTGNLDSESGKAVLTLLAEMNTEDGITVVMATHSQEAAEFAGRELILRDGSLSR